MQLRNGKIKGSQVIACLVLLIFMLTICQAAFAKVTSSGGKSSGSSSSRSSYSGSSSSRSVPKSYSSSSAKSASSGTSGYSGAKQSSKASKPDYEPPKSSGTKDIDSTAAKKPKTTSSASSKPRTYDVSKADEAQNSTTTTKPKTTTAPTASQSNSSTASKTDYSGAANSGTKGVNSTTAGSQKATAATGKSQSKKAAYMEETYKKGLSKSNYTAYNQKLDDNQQKAYDQSVNRSYTVNNRMDLDDAMATRQQRMNRYDSYPVRTSVNISMFPGSLGYGSSFIGPFDLWYITRASDMFWYNHWDLINPYRTWFDPVGFAAREAMIHQMEMQHIQRDLNYTDNDWDYDLTYSPEYQKSHIGDLYSTRKTFRGFWTSFWIFVILLACIVLIIFVIRKISKARHMRANAFNPGNSIY